MPEHYRVRISPRASANLEEIHRHIEADSPQNAASVIEDLLDAMESLDQLPRRYPIYQGRRRPREMVRRMPVPPFLIYYRVNESALSVDVLAVRHGSRRQPRSFK
jgi:plasmid stabilization system protein ParE